MSGSYGENETLDRTYSEFRNSGYSLDSEDRGRITSRNIRELLSLVYKINDRHSIGLGGQIFMGASDPSNTVHTTSAGLAWGDVPPQMPEAGYTLYRYGGTLYNRQYQGSLNYIFRFDTLGSRLSFKADYLHQNVDRNYDYDTRDFSRPEDAEPFSTELRRERYKLLHFRFKNGQWVSNNGSIPKETYQGRLSNLYEKRCKHYSHPVKELVSFARKQARNADGINTAIRTLEIATLRATSREAKGFLATLCSLYRRAGLPNAVASLYDYAVGKYGKQVETPPFLTSVSAAFMDIGDIEMADIMRNKASLLIGGDDAKLTHFSRRFDTETQFERDENDEK